MSALLIILILIAGLFAGAFLSKRRFGLLALGLTAGAIIAPIWGENAGFVVSATGLVQEGPIVNVIATGAITLIPAILFMFHGYSYKGMFGRLVGSFMFAALAVAFLITPLNSVLTITGPIGTVYQWFIANHEFVISAGVVIAVVDVLTARAVHKSKKKQHEH